MALLEICVDSVASAIAAQAGGADRIELCSGLAEGGVTPSLGLLRAVCAQTRLPVHVIIRPRAGDFVYSTGELGVMREDIGLARQAGAQGIVFGILTDSRTVDEQNTRALLEAARPMDVTFHRAFDLARDLDEALEALVRSGVPRLLTSGGEPTALVGAERIRLLVRRAGERIRVMVGGHVRAESIRELLMTGATEFHSGMSQATLASERLPFGAARIVSEQQVRLLKRMLADHSRSASPELER